MSDGPPVATRAAGRSPAAAPSPTAALSPTSREAAISALCDGELDVLVVGGGVVGTGALLDAASRGLRAGLVEATDLAAGASSASSKLLHGGVRYLQMLDFALVREALAERSLLFELAPHLVRPVAFLFPLRHRVWERAYVGAGLTLYDAFARAGRAGATARPGANVRAGAAGRLPRHRQLGRRSAEALAPGLRPPLAGAIEYWDAQVDDARFVVDLARRAASLGAHVVTGARLVGFLEDESGSGVPVVSRPVLGARIRLEDGRELAVRARTVLAATGAWSAELQASAGLSGAVPLRPSKGVHLVVARAAVRSQRALVVPTDRSVLFVLPWGQHWIVGTTDTPWQLGPEHPVATRRDVEYLLEEANNVLDPPLRHADIEAVYAGLRPLVATGGAETTKVSREHAVSRLRPRLYLITGGKYTTYRVMARDAIDALSGKLGRSVPPSSTASIPLAGAAGFEERFARRIRLAADHGLEPAVFERLLHRYGGLIGELLASGQDPTRAGGERRGGLGPFDPLPGGAGYLAIEARYAASHEGARHLGDVIERRLRLAIEHADRGLEAAPAVAAQVAPELGWSAQTMRAELEAYRRRVEGEHRAEQAPDDDSAARAAAGIEDGAAAPSANGQHA